MSSESDSSGLIVILLLLIFLYLPAGNKEHKSYSEHCSGLGTGVHGDIATCEKTFLNAKVYFAVPEKQIVISKGLWSKYDDCTVIDSENWHCKTYNGYMVMEDGWYRESNTEKTASSWRTIGYFEYLYKWWGQNLGDVRGLLNTKKAVE